MRDQIKIVSNEQEKTLAYFCKNENEEWMAVPNTSKLSRIEYTRTTLQKKGKDILNEINTNYNLRGLDIVFIGSKNSYDYLQAIIKTDFPHENIVCQYRQKNVAVVGRGASGKTTLINALLEKSGNNYHRDEYHSMHVYKNSSVKWYELPSIETESDIIKAKNILDELVDLTDIIYCFMSSRIIHEEKELIRYITSTYPSVNINIVLTRCADAYNERSFKNEFADMPRAHVIATMAMPLKTKSGSVGAYGIDDVISMLALQ